MRIELEHTFIGDLLITLTPPASTGVAPIVLHNQGGGSTHDIKRTYDAVNTPGLAGLAGKSCKGSWTLEIEDRAFRDVGRLTTFELSLSFGPAAGGRAATRKPRKPRKKKAAKRARRTRRAAKKAAPRPRKAAKKRRAAKKKKKKARS